MSWTGPVGAGLTAGGMVFNGMGQARAMDAMRGVWNRANERIAGFDNQMADQTGTLIAGMTPEQMLGTGYAGELRGRLDTDAGNLAAAVRQLGARKGAGSSAGAETRATNQQRSSTTLADALRDNQVVSQRAGLQHGARTTATKRRTHATEQARIQDALAQFRELVALQEQAAASKGGWLRDLGNWLNIGGQALMAQGMWGGGSGGGMPPVSGAAIAQEPVGGWAASSIDELGPGRQGAWS